MLSVNGTKKNSLFLVVIVYLLFPLSAMAAPPQMMTYQGRLTDNNGEPVEDTLDMSFRIFEEETGGQALWSDIYESIDINDGSFSVQLDFNDQSQEIFDGRPLWLEVKIGNDILTPRSSIDSVPYAFYAQNAVNAQNTIAFNDKSYDDVVAAAASAALDVPVDRFEDQDGESLKLLNVIEQLSSRIDELEGKLNDEPDPDEEQPPGVFARLDALEAEAQRFDDLTANMSRQTIYGYDSIVFEDVNIHIRNSMGAVSWEDPEGYEGQNVYTVDIESMKEKNNGLGNLIIGYDEIAQQDEPGEDGLYWTKHGSHNLIVGPGHRYMSVGGLVAGIENYIGERGATVTGGRYNNATKPMSSISGGRGNLTDGVAASISGGTANQIHWDHSSISGGHKNIIGSPDQSGEKNHEFASISGGTQNHVCSLGGSISAGSENKIGYFDTNGECETVGRSKNASVSGGQKNHVYGSYSSITGGQENKVQGALASITSGFKNEAYGFYSSITGGFWNKTGASETPAFQAIGASISGGKNNLACGYGSSISAGEKNRTGVLEGEACKVPDLEDTSDPNSPRFLKDIQDSPTGLFSSILGGTENSTRGDYSSIGGGYSKNLSDEYGWAIGDTSPGGP